MSIPKVLFVDGHDTYTNDLWFMQETMETELQNRLKHISLTKGVAEGMEANTSNDSVDIQVGFAYDDDRSMMEIAGGQLAVPLDGAGGDAGKFVVIEQVTTDSVPDAHPVTGISALRRRLTSVVASVVTSPTTNQVRICNITSHTGGAPPVVNITPPNRDILTLGIGVIGGSVSNPYTVVASDGSGDFTTLQAAVDDLPSSGGMIFIKAGTYDITTKVTVAKDNVLIRGSGPNTILRMDGTSDDIVLHVDGGGVGGVEGVRIENMAFDWGTGDPGATQNNPCVKVSTAVDTVIRGCVFFDNQTIDDPIGVEIGEAAHQTRVLNCFTPATNGVRFAVIGEPSATATDCIIADCEFLTVRRGVWGKAGTDRWVVRGVLTTSDAFGADSGVKVDDGEDWVIQSNMFSGHGAGVDLTASAAAATIGIGITGNVIIGGTTGVAIGGDVDRTLVVGNNLRNNTSAWTDSGTLSVIQDNRT